MRGWSDWFRKWRWRRVLMLCGVLACLSVPLANAITHAVMERFLATTFGGEASIETVRLGIRQSTVTGLCIRSLGSEYPIVSLAQFRLRLSIWDGIRRGVWVETLSLNRPTIQLHFDADGVLLTRLPDFPSDKSDAPPPEVLPFRDISIKNARLVIHQVGRRALDVDECSVSAHSNGAILKFDGAVPDIFRAQVGMSGSFNTRTSVASSQLTIGRLQVASRDLIALPLVPPSINSVPWSATTSVQFKHSGVISDLRKQSVDVRLDELAMTTVDQDSLVTLTGTAKMTDGSLAIGVSGTVLDGNFELTGGASLGENSLTNLTSLHAAVRCDGMRSDTLPVGFLPNDTTGCLSVGGVLKAHLLDGVLTVRGASESEVTETFVHGVRIAPTRIACALDGALDLSNGGTRSRGLLSMDAASEGVSLADIAAVSLQDGKSVIPSSEPRPRLVQEDAPKDWLSLAGSVRGAARMEIPLATIFDPKTFLVNAIVDASGVEAQDIRLGNAVGNIRVSEGTASLRLEDLRVVDLQTSETTLVKLHVFSDGELAADAVAELQIDHLSAAMAARLAGVFNHDVQGAISVFGNARCPVGQIGNVEAWSGKLKLTAQDVMLDDLPLANFAARCDLAQGRCQLWGMQGDVAGGDLAARASLSLVSPFAFQSSLELRSVDLSYVSTWCQRPPPSVAPANGICDLSLNAAGLIADRKWEATGSLTGANLFVGGRSFSTTRLNFVADPEVVRVFGAPNGVLGANLEVRLLGLAGLIGATYDDTTPQLVGHISELPVSAIAGLMGLREPVDGLINCEFNATDFSDLSHIRIHALADSPAISIRKGVAKNVRIDLQIRECIAAATIATEGLGGNVSVRLNANVDRLLKVPPEQWQRPGGLPIEILGAAKGVELGRIWPLVGKERELRALQGTVDVTLQRGPSEQQNDELAECVVQLRGLRWDGVLWSRQLHGDIVLKQDQLEIRRFAGPFANGRFTSRATVSLLPGNRGSFEWTASRLSLEKLLVPLDRRGELVQGECSLRMRGRLGPRPSGNLFISMDRGSAGPIALGGVRLPIDWSLDPRTSSARWRMTNAGVELGGGRLIANTDGRWNGKLDVNLTAQARHVDTGRILKGKPAASAGFLDGTMRLSARRATTAKQLTGTFKATLTDANSMEIPVVSDLTKFISAIPTTTTYDESQIEGRLGNGIVHLERITLGASNVQMLAEGTATLQGRLNVRVMAKTDESGPADQLLRLADSPLLMAAPTPLALVAKANNALKDRVLHLRIRGTAARPAIQLEPGRQLGQEAVKYFVNQAIGFRKQSDVLSF